MSLRLVEDRDVEIALRRATWLCHRRLVSVVLVQAKQTALTVWNHASLRIEVCAPLATRQIDKRALLRLRIGNLGAQKNRLRYRSRLESRSTR